MSTGVWCPIKLHSILGGCHFLHSTMATGMCPKKEHPLDHPLAPGSESYFPNVPQLQTQHCMRIGYKESPKNRKVWLGIQLVTPSPWAAAVTFCFVGCCRWLCPWFPQNLINHHWPLSTVVKHLLSFRHHSRHHSPYVWVILERNLHSQDVNLAVWISPSAPLQFLDLVTQPIEMSFS